MIPQSNLENVTTIEEKLQPSKTYKLDYANNKIEGFTNGLEAIKQAVYKILDTERYEYLIYSFNYGVEFDVLIGQDELFVRADLKRRIEEALKQDDRIIRITNLSMVKGNEADSLVVVFDVETTEGSISVERMVRT